jgi:hypothetical protein
MFPNIKKTKKKKFRKFRNLTFILSDPNRKSCPYKKEKKETLEMFPKNKRKFRNEMHETYRFQ